MRFRTKALVLLALAVLVPPAASCLRGPKPAPAPALTTAFSPALGIRVTYDPEVFTSIVSEGSSEFPLYLRGEDYNLGIKRIRAAGILLAKEPQADFFQFFAQQVRFQLIKAGLTPLEPEVDEEFTAQGKAGLCQILHFRNPEDTKLIPSYVPQEPGAEYYLYYHHFYSKPDYFFFTAISRQALTPEQRAEIVALIDATEFNAQPIAAEEE
ncbi:hypothetical protein J7J84_05080 [bacterium]|nr:hypothetical protein [bacterium]